MENATPMLRQYLDIKKEHPGAILFFRLGDFYEMFNEDALVGSRELNITLTARHKDSPNPIPMCGVPHHSAAAYISKLVSKGYRVAICEQAEPAGKGVKLVKREVVRVITPGTSIDSQLVKGNEPVFLASLFYSKDVCGAAFLDVSTGEFLATETSGTNALLEILAQIDLFAPKEILVSESQADFLGRKLGGHDAGSLLNTEDVLRTSNGGFAVTKCDDRHFDLETTADCLKTQFRTKLLTPFGLDGHPAAISAAGACLAYARMTQKAEATHVSSLQYVSREDSLVLDEQTIRNLDIFQSRSDDNKRTLLGVLDETLTNMGGRLLRSWLSRPSVKLSEITTRQNALKDLGDSVLREKLRSLLKNISDLERLAGRLNLRNATPRDLLSLVRSLELVPEITAPLAALPSLLLQVLGENTFALPETQSLIGKAIADEPPNNISDGGLIRPGFNSELDDLRALATSGKQFIASIETRERERTNIPTLKVRHNNVFGYYIEVSKAQLSRVPPDYERRQTLANAERFSTGELKEWEQKVFGAEDRICELEGEIFAGVLEQVRQVTSELQSTARAIATLDVLAGLAHAAARRNYTCPQVHDGDAVEIKNGRHPIVEAFLNESFVPNDVVLNNSTDRLLVVTGANMGGKSTILRQVGLIQILAQIGSFVPAESARIAIADRIWTRVGASDDLASGRSTFMVEMTETAAILRNATARSLVLMDEIGRGTSTFDGLSIAWAVAQYLHDSPEHSAKTLFATHYHELTELADRMPGAKNYQMAATEKDGDVVFLHKLVKGKASKSYGIAVARLAGLPVSVLDRAKEVLEKLEKYELAVFSSEKPEGLALAAGQKRATQNSLFAISNEAAIDQLRDLSIESLEPEDGLRILKEIRSKIN